MRIKFERSGGVMGRTLTFEVDTETLPGDESQELEQLVERSEFFTLPASPDVEDTSPDEFAYTVRVESGGREHTIETTDSAAPAALLPLLDRLSWMARGSRGT